MVGAAQNLVRNGSFESGPAIPEGGLLLALPVGDSRIEGWTVAAGDVDVVGSYWKASDGARSLDLSGYQAGAISQELATLVGGRYEVTFDLSGEPGGHPPTVKHLRVTAAANAAEFTFDTTRGTSRAAMVWEQRSFTFTATNTTTVLRFDSLDASDAGPALDNVRAFLIPSAAGLVIKGIRAQPAEPVEIRIPASSDAYYLLYRGEQVQQILLPRDIRLGQSPEIILTDPVPRPDTAFYRVEQIPIATPRDTDGDGMDDVFELRHPAACKPLVADGDQDPDRDGKSNLEEYILGTDPGTANVPPLVRLVAPNDLDVLFLPGPFELTAEASDAEGPLSSVEMLVGETVLAALTNAPFTFFWTNAPVGTNRLTARATDQFGARATSGPVTVRIRFPNSPPSVTITAPETNSIHALPVAIEVLVAASDSEGPVESVRLLFNRTNLLATLNTAPFAFAWTNAPLGTNELTAVALDSDGASVTSAPVSIRVINGNQAPDFAAIADQAVDEEKPLSLTLSATDADLPPQTLTFRLISGPEGLNVTAAGALSWTPTEAQGPTNVVVLVSVTDGELAVTNRINVAVREVNVAPVLAAVADQMVDEEKPLALTLSATDDDLPRQTLTFRLVSGPEGLNVTPAGVLSWTPTEAQGPTNVAVLVSVTDGELAVTNRINVAVRELNVAPVLAAVADQTVDEEKTLSLTLNATDADEPRQTLVYGLVSGPAGLSVSPTGALSWTPTEAQGPTNVVVLVSVADGELAVTNRINVAVREVNVAPVLAAVADQSVDEEKPLALTLSATDADEPRQTLVYGLVSGPAGLTVTAAGALSWTPTEAQGPTNVAVLVSVTDGELAVTNRFNVAVREVNLPPVLAAIADQAVDEGKTLSLILSGIDTDEPRQTLVFGLVNGPEGMSVSPTGALSWTPTEAQGPTNVVVLVSATDGQVSVTNRFTVTVLEVTALPVFPEIADQAVDELTPLNLQLTATDSDVPAQTLTFGLVRGPEGMSVTSAGALSWTPTEAQGPTNVAVLVSVTDGQSAVTNAFNVTAREVNLAPVATLVTNRFAVDELALLSVTNFATDADLPANGLKWRLVTGPAGATLNDRSGVWSWIPALGQGASNPEVVVAVDDDGVPPRSATNAFTVEVRRVEIPPTVRLAEPLGSVAYPAPGYVKLLAEARSTNAAIARVEFLAGTNVIGSATTAPYRLNWDNVPAGEYVLTVRAVDTLGVAATNGVPTLVKVTPLDTEPLTTLSSSPSPGETGVAVTRETVLRFSCPLRDDAILTLDRFNAVADGRRVLSRIELSTDRRTATLFYLENLPASSRVRVTFNADGLYDCLGRELDADGDGAPGGVATIDFDTLATVAIARTAVVGRVFASEPVAGSGSTNFLNRPLKGVTITVDGAEETLRTTTDAQGNFRLEPCPSGRFFVHVDGRTAEGSQWPNGAYYPFVGKAWDAVAGRVDNLANGNGEIYLPLVPAAALQPVSATEDTRITFAPDTLAANPDLAGVSITVPANSLLSENGARGGRVGIAAVPPERLPEPLPPGLNFPLVITVQTDGPQNFDRPVPVRFPNLPDPVTGLSLQPGETTTLWSFVHDTGRWEPQGTMTVSADGRFVESNPGVGIRQPGWHGTTDCPTCCEEPPPITNDDWWNLGDAGLTCAAEFTGIKKGLECLSQLVEYTRSTANLINNLIEAMDKRNSSVCQLLKGGYAALVRLKELIDITNTCVANEGPIGKAEAAFSCLSGLLDAAKEWCHRIVFVDPGQCEPSIVQRYLCAGVEVLLRLAETAKEYIAEGKNLQKAIVNVAANEVLRQVEGYLNEICPEPSATGTLQSEKSLRQSTLQNVSDERIRQIISELKAIQTRLEMVGSAAESLQAASVAFQDAYDAANGQQQFQLRIRPKPGDSVYYAVFFGSDVFRGKAAIGEVRYPSIPRGVAFRWAEFYPGGRLYGARNGVVPMRGVVSLSVDSLIPDEQMLDSDADGLSDDAEAVIGTNPNVDDSDGDGVPDGEEIRQGTDPLDGRVAQTGVINSLPVTGTAVDVSAANDVVAVAAAEGGVTLFNTLNPARPLRVGQVDTPGNAISVASIGSRVVAADGDAGVAIIDFTDPANPQLVRQVGPGALGGGSIQAVAAAADLAFAGSTSGQVSLLDLATGAVFQTLDLGGRVEDLAIEGLTLYAYAGDRLHVLPFGKGLLERSGSVVSPAPSGINMFNGRGRLFVGNDVAYVTHATGFNAISVRDPAAPRLLAEGNSQQRGWKHTVVNGSGRGIAAFSPNLTFDGPHNVGLYDTRNLNAGNMDDKFVTQFETPGIARAVTLYNGLGYVADHSAGMQVVNYLEPDLGTNAPTGRLVQSETNEISVGGLMLLRAEVTDDVQVRQVEFQVNGQRIAVDGNFPFEAVYRVPAGALGTPQVFSVRASDMGGNSLTLTNPPVTVLPDAQGPAIAVVSPADGTEVSRGESLAVELTLLDNVDGPNVSSIGFEVDGQPVPFERFTRTGFTVSAPTVLGEHVLVAVARDAAGNVGRSLPVRFYVYVAAVSRAVSVQLPDPANVAGAAVSRAVSVSLNDAATAGEQAVSRAVSVQWLDLATAGGSAVSRAVSVDFPDPASLAGNASSRAVNVLLTNLPSGGEGEGPVILLAAPTNGFEVYRGEAFTAEVTLPNAPDIMEIWLEVDGQRIAAEPLTANTFLLNPTLALGGHALVAKARNAAGQVGQSPAVQFWVYVSAVSRAVSVQLADPVTVTGTAVSRAVSVSLRDLATAGEQAVSRAISVQLQDRAGAGSNAVSRAVSVQFPDPEIARGTASSRAVNVLLTNLPAGLNSSRPAPGQPLSQAAK